jgi:pimeloyl-ACP methyl ester carboxylesterase
VRDFELDRGKSRVVRVRTAGAAAGPLVVYFHGAPSSRLDIDAVSQESADRGVRVAAFDRPGFGGSDPAAFTLASIAEDACAVADELGAERFAVVGQSAGCGYALAVAALHPRRITAAATGGGSVSFEPGEASWDLLSDAEKQGVSLIGIDDDEAERLLAAPDIPMVDALGLDDVALETFWRDVLSPADQRTLDSGFAAALFVATMRESLRQGQVGWARDNVVRMGTWPIAFGDISSPVTLWYGEQDTLPHESVAWLQQRLPHATAHVLPDRGHLVVFDEWPQVLRSLGL